MVQTNEQLSLPSLSQSQWIGDRAVGQVRQGVPGQPRERGPAPDVPAPTAPKQLLAAELVVLCSESGAGVLSSAHGE